jgi:uncharacterized protein
MLFNLGLLILFALLLRLEKKNLSVFGLQPIQKRLLQLLIGFALTAVLFTIINVLFAVLANFSWTLNNNYTTLELVNGVYRTFNSVIYEELIFRSYLLYKLLQWLGERKAVLITSALFGMYHWFTFGLLGNFPMMIWIFFYTGLWGAMYAYSYTRTGSIFLMIGLHWGWNFFDQLIFEKNGSGLLKPLITDNTVILDQTTGFLVTSLLSILFAISMIVYLTRKRVELA